MTVRRMVCTLLLTGFGAGAFAQSNTVIDELLAQDQATFGPVAYLVLSAAGIIEEQASVSQAMEKLSEQGWKLEAEAESEPIELGEYAFMLMQAFHVPGGIMYSIIPGPRYAGRELAFLGFVPGSASPGRPVSGEEVVRILGNLLESRGGRS